MSIVYRDGEDIEPTEYEKEVGLALMDIQVKRLKEERNALAIKNEELELELSILKASKNLTQIERDELAINNTILRKELAAAEYRVKRLEERVRW